MSGVGEFAGEAVGGEQVEVAGLGGVGGDVGLDDRAAEPMARVMTLRMGEAAAWARVRRPARICSSTREWSRVRSSRAPRRKR